MSGSDIEHPESTPTVRPFECIVYAPDAFEAEELTALEQRVGESHCHRVTEAPALAEETFHGSRRLVLYRHGCGVERTRALFERLGRLEERVPAVCIVNDGEWREATSALREGASDYLFAEQLHSEYLSEVLRASLGRSDVGERERRVQRELKQRSSELLGLNALANGISSTLDHETIIRRGLWVFAGVCQQSAVALLELQPPPEVFDSGADRGDGDETSKLVQIASFSSSGVQLECGEVVLDESWKNVIREDHVVKLAGPRDGGSFAGLDGFWERHPEGILRLLPLRANRRAIGALVLAQVDPPEDDIAISREGLRAMAMQFGGALENARLFREVADAYESLQSTQDQLVHAEKFAAVGILAAEIAHEINNPASFVISNLSVMDEYVEAIAGFLDEVEDRIREGDEHLEAEFERLKEEFEINFMRDDMDSLLSRSLSGMQRIHQIVQDLRYLSRDSGEDPGWIELDSLIDATVNLVRHEAKFRADLELDYGDVPQVMSDASRLSQVFLNLLVNAVQAIEVGDVEDNKIRVATRRADDAVRVIVEDSGSGIPPEAEDRIFDPFFTTKETGEGTGLGLSISRDIVRSLGGEIDFDSTPGEGTRFEVTIPVRAEKFKDDRELRDSGYYDMPPGLEELSEQIFE